MERTRGVRTGGHVLIVLLLIVLAQSVARTVWPITNTDTPAIMCMVARQQDAALFSRDCAFSGEGSYRGYNPLYRLIVRVLSPAGAVPWIGLLLLFPPVLFAALAGLWLVMREVVGDSWLVLPLVLAASFIRDSGGGWYWGMTWEAEPLARYVFFGPALLCFVPLLRSWPRVSLWGGALALGAGGALANLHPPSAPGWVMTLFVLILLAEGPWRRKAGTLALGAALVIVASLPVVISTVEMLGRSVPASATHSAAAPFGEYARGMLGRYEGIFPWVMRPLRGGSLLPGRAWLWPLVGLYAGCMGFWCARYGLRGAERRRSRASWVWLLALQMPFFFVLSRLRAVDLVCIVAAYAVLRRREAVVERVEWLAVTLLSCMVGIAWLGSPAVRIAWELGGYRFLTDVAINSMRFLRLVYLPVWLLAALWVRHRAWRRTLLPLVVVFVALMYPWRGEPAFFILTLAGVAGTELAARRRLTGWARAALHGALAAALAMGIASYHDGVAPRGLIATAALSAGVAALLLRRAWDARGARRALAVAGSVLAVVGGLWLQGGAVRTEVVRAGGYVLDRFTVRDRRAAERELETWARTRTPKGALFYVSDADLFAHRFRAFAQRSVVHTQRQRFSRPEYAAYWEAPFAARDASGVAARAREAGVDYVVTAADFPELGQGRAAYRNGSFRVIEMGAGPGAARQR